MKTRDPEQLYPHDHMVRLCTDWLPKWVRPNHITTLRMVLTPIVLVGLWTQQYSWGVPLFMVTAFTDAMDGTLARTRKQITKWGTFFDPVADKLLIGFSALLIVTQHLETWFAALIIFIEVLIITFGAIRRGKGEVVHANTWGKVKMFLQVMGLFLLLLSLWFAVPVLLQVSVIVLATSIIFALGSLVTYGI